MALVVGLTGGIGSGKSAVADAFAALGIEVTDTDRLAHALTAPGEPGHAAILEAFGTGYFRADGTLDRARLRARVFGDAGARARLEAILHPLIRAAAAREVAALDEPLRPSRRAAAVRARRPPGPRAARARRRLPGRRRRSAGSWPRSGLTEAEVRAIMATQLSRAERLARADDVIDNAGPLDAIAPQVAALDRRYRALAAAPAADGPAYRRRPTCGRMRPTDATAARLTVIRYEHPLNERIRTLMRLEDLFARAQYFAAQDGRARPSRRAARAVRDHRRRRPRRPEDRHPAGARAAEAAARAAAHESRDRAARARAAARRNRRRQRAACSRRRARSARTCATTSG